MRAYGTHSMDVHDIRHAGEEPLVLIEVVQHRVDVPSAVLIVQVTNLKVTVREVLI